MKPHIKHIENEISEKLNPFVQKKWTYANTIYPYNVFNRKIRIEDVIHIFYIPKMIDISIDLFHPKMKVHDKLIEFIEGIENFDGIQISVKCLQKLFNEQVVLLFYESDYSNFEWNRFKSLAPKKTLQKTMDALHRQGVIEFDNALYKSRTYNQNVVFDSLAEMETFCNIDLSEMHFLDEERY